jgi:heat shock protein HtpX
VADTTDLFARRNRFRIAALILLATINYCLAVAAAAVAVGLGLLLAALFQFDVFPDSGDGFEALGFVFLGVIVISAVVGLVLALCKIPFARSSLERQVFRETGARIATPSEHVEIKNVLEALAIAAGIPVPRFAVLDDAAPNSFGVGTRPSNTILGITTGLSAVLSRDELEAVLAYEVSRIRSWDVALSSWTVALTSGAISAVDAADDGFLKGIVGWVPRRLGEWLQLWALRDQAFDRDRAAIRFTRNPLSLVRALEKLDADTSQVTKVSRATAPLWIEFPARVVAGSSSRATRRLGQELLLDERIDALRALAGTPPPSSPNAPG